VSPFEDALRAELSWLVRAEVPARALRLTVRDRVVTHLERGPLGAHEVSLAVEDAVRAACRLVRELDAPDEVVDIVCRAALEAVRGHGGQSARWLAEATTTADAVLEELARRPGEEPVWRWLEARTSRW
jgi:hypothetical protein